MKKPDTEKGISAIVIGARSAIAECVTRKFIADESIDRIIAISRSGPAPGVLCSDKVCEVVSDYSEDSISRVCADLAEEEETIGFVTIFIGMLHKGQMKPEKRLEDVSAVKLQEVLYANAVIPLIWLAKLSPLLKSNISCRIAVMSARVGSIEDNRSGGWYAYRSSKAALNMMLRTAAIELRRRAPNATLIAFHPGTTETALSKPYLHGVPEGKLFKPEFVAEALMSLLRSLQHDSEARFYDWEGKLIPW